MWNNEPVKPEGIFGGTAFTFTVHRSGSSLDHTTLVNYAVAGFGPNPASPNDFVGNAYPSGTIQFLPGQVIYLLEIMVNGDTQSEPDEGFIVTLSTPSFPTVIDIATATGVIQRDELEGGNSGNTTSNASTVDRLGSSALSLIRRVTSLPVSPIPTEPSDQLWFKPPKKFSKAWWRRRLKFW